MISLVRFIARSKRLTETLAAKTSPIERDLILRIASLCSILLASFHIADDVVRGFEPGGFKNIYAILILVVWLYGTLVLAGKRSGYLVMLLGGVLGAMMCYAHMRGAGVVGGRIAASSGVFFWVWTLLALAVTSTFSAVLAARGLFAGASRQRSFAT
jgi:hypothetical protein